MMKTIGCRLLPRLTALLVAVSVCLGAGAASVGAVKNGEAMLYPGGMPFGVKLYSDGVLIVGIGEVRCGNTVSSPAGDAGLLADDIILSVCGERVNDAAGVSALVEKSGGRTIEIAVRRGKSELYFSVTPAMSDDGSYKAGLIIRDGTAGIGTVTYIEPEIGSFAGLGHGICDSESGELVPLTRGAVVGAKISGVVKGESGAPGELQGYFCTGKIGTVTDNTECGVYGVFCDIPTGLYTEPLPAAKASEIKEGEAEVLCTTGDDGIGRYTVRISDIDRSGRETKNFVVTVTDEELLSRTGGIVQGMSGSPIIQDGKLVGAVTHVLISDPTKGYGIFIENMLDAAG